MSDKEWQVGDLALVRFHKELPPAGLVKIIKIRDQPVDEVYVKCVTALIDWVPSASTPPGYVLLRPGEIWNLPKSKLERFA